MLLQSTLKTECLTQQSRTWHPMRRFMVKNQQSAICNRLGKHAMCISQRTVDLLAASCFHVQKKAFSLDTLIPLPYIRSIYQPENTLLLFPRLMLNSTKRSLYSIRPLSLNSIWPLHSIRPLSLNSIRPLNSIRHISKNIFMSRRMHLASGRMVLSYASHVLGHNYIQLQVSDTIS